MQKEEEEDTRINNLFHEKQDLRRCAIHACNNLFQEQVFTKRDFDKICHTLSPNKWLNPHKSYFGVGNYDVNVIISAIGSKGYDVRWFDSRKDPAEEIKLKSIFGIIINSTREKALGIKTHHWFALRSVEKIWYSFDSKLDLPKKFKNKKKIFTYLSKIIEKQGQILTIHSQNTETITEKKKLKKKKSKTKKKNEKITNSKKEILSDSQKEVISDSQKEISDSQTSGIESSEIDFYIKKRKKPKKNQIKKSQ